MRSEIVTSAIVGQFLRALEVVDIDVARVEGLLLELPVADVLDEIVDLLDTPDDEFDVAVRLTLCAASEEARHMSEMLGGNPLFAAERHGLDAIRIRLLFRAGVSDTRWEEARCV